MGKQDTAGQTGGHPGDDARYATEAAWGAARRTATGIPNDERRQASRLVSCDQPGHKCLWSQCPRTGRGEREGYCPLAEAYLCVPPAPERGLAGGHTGRPGAHQSGDDAPVCSPEQGRECRETGGDYVDCPELDVVEARLASLTSMDLSWLYDGDDLSPPDGGPEVIGPAEYHHEHSNAGDGCRFNSGALCTGTGMCVWRVGRGHPCLEHGAGCPVVRECPYDRPSAEGAKLAHLPIRTPVDPTPDPTLTNWSA